MPQRVKGGKHVYGRSKVDQKGTVAVPDEANQVYNLKTPSTKEREPSDVQLTLLR